MATTSIPWQCWEAPGFKTCHAKQWEAARNLCEINAAQVYGGDMKRCIAEASIIKTMSECGALCPAEAAPNVPGAPNVPPPSQELPIGPVTAPRAVSTTTLVIGGVILGTVAILLMRK